MIPLPLHAYYGREQAFEERRTRFHEVCARQFVREEESIIEITKRKRKGKKKGKAQAKPVPTRATIVRRIDRSEFDGMKNGQLDTLQSEAADMFEKLYIRSQLSGQGMDPTREQVDGGKGYYEIPDHVIDCQNKLGRAARHIGMISYAIVYKFICQGLTARQIAFQFGEQGDRAERHYRRRFRDSLTELADLWFPSKTSRRRASFIRSEVSTVVPEMWESVDE